MRTGSRRCCTEGHHFLHHSIAPGGAEGRQAERDHHAEDFVDYTTRTARDAIVTWWQFWPVEGPRPAK
jgi:hypothetical protein